VLPNPAGRPTEQCSATVSWSATAKLSGLLITDLSHSVVRLTDHWSVRASSQAY